MPKTMLEQLEDALKIDQDDLHEALLQQPQLYWQVAEQVALAVSRRDEAEKELELVEARADLAIRRAAQERKQDTTEKLIKSRVLLHPSMEKATRELQDLELDASEWKALERSYSQRMDALKKLVDLTLKNYWSESGISGFVDSMKTHNANLARRDLNARRRAGWTGS